MKEFCLSYCTYCTVTLYNVQANERYRTENLLNNVLDYHAKEHVP
jgi:uncharacterized protein YuzB (UPF0349 family)